MASPLLANIALHGLEDAIRAAFHTWRTKPRVERWKPFVVRYADDFVVLHRDRAVIERAQAVAAAWLAEMGLELHPEKTRVVHTALETDGYRPGFDFLGFTVRSFPAKQRRGKKGTKTFIKPSAESQKRHYHALAAIVERHPSSKQAALIAELNPVIRGWAHYCSTQASKECFSRLDWLLHRKLKRWAKRRHSHKPKRWWYRRYWTGPPWRFAVPNGGIGLRTHSAMPIRRHVKVAGQRSPFDGDWLYWTTRMGRHPLVAPQVARLLRHQRGHCAGCGLYFKDGDVIENDHLVPRSRQGTDRDANRQLLHRHCHDTKSVRDKGLGD